MRAKNKIAAARIPYRVPPPGEFPERLAAVLGTIYLLFNEGYSATDSESLVRADLSSEALRLARLLVELMPQEPEAMGLLALVPLEEQDRSCWDRAKIAEGLAVIDRAIALRLRGPYQLQAAARHRDVAQRRGKALPRAAPARSHGVAHAAVRT